MGFGSSGVGSEGAGSLICIAGWLADEVEINPGVWMKLTVGNGC